MFSTIGHQVAVPIGGLCHVSGGGDGTLRLRLDRLSNLSSLHQPSASAKLRAPHHGKTPPEAER